MYTAAGDPHYNDSRVNISRLWLALLAHGVCSGTKFYPGHHWGPIPIIFFPFRAPELLTMLSSVCTRMEAS